MHYWPRALFTFDYNIIIHFRRCDGKHSDSDNNNNGNADIVDVICIRSIEETLFYKNENARVCVCVCARFRSQCPQRKISLPRKNARPRPSGAILMTNEMQKTTKKKQQNKNFGKQFEGFGFAQFRIAPFPPRTVEGNRPNVPRV